MEWPEWRMVWWLVSTIVTQPFLFDLFATRLPRYARNDRVGLRADFDWSIIEICHCEEERRSNLVAMLSNLFTTRLPRYARNDKWVKWISLINHKYYDCHCEEERRSNLLAVLIEYANYEIATLRSQWQSGTKSRLSRIKYYKLSLRGGTTKQSRSYAYATC